MISSYSVFDIFLTPYICLYFRIIFDIRQSLVCTKIPKITVCFVGFYLLHCKWCGDPATLFLLLFIIPIMIGHTDFNTVLVHEEIVIITVIKDLSAQDFPILLRLQRIYYDRIRCFFFHPFLPFFYKFRIYIDDFTRFIDFSV